MGNFEESESPRGRCVEDGMEFLDYLPGVCKDGADDQKMDLPALVLLDLNMPGRDDGRP